MVWVPAVIKPSKQVAGPEATDFAPQPVIVAPLSVKVTVPVIAALLLTVAVKAGVDSPHMLGLVRDTRVVTLESAFTTCVKVALPGAMFGVPL